MNNIYQHQSGYSAGMGLTIEQMITVKVLGLGNVQHRRLSHNLNLALQKNGITAQVEQITDIEDILKLKVHAIPALILKDVTLIADKELPTVDEIYELLVEAQAYSSRMDLKSAGE